MLLCKKTETICSWTRPPLKILILLCLFQNSISNHDSESISFKKKKKSLLKENTLQCPGDDALLWLGGLNPVVCPFSFWAMWQLATCVLFLFLSLPLYWWGWCPFGSLRKATVLQENLALASSTAPCFVKRSKRQLIWFSYYSALAAPSARKRRGGSQTLQSDDPYAAAGLLVEN